MPAGEGSVSGSKMADNPIPHLEEETVATFELELPKCTSHASIASKVAARSQHLRSFHSDKGQQQKQQYSDSGVGNISGGE